MRHKKRFIALWFVLCAGLLWGALMMPGHGHVGSIQVMMRDAVLHEVNRVSFFGLLDVSPALVSAYCVTGILLLAALVLRLLVIPRFQYVPGKLQLLLEDLVGMFDRMAKTASPHKNRVLGVYLFTAGIYIFSSTLFELFGVQITTTGGHIIPLPAPLADINGAIALGCLSYLFLLSGGIMGAGAKGIARTLKEFSLPISMSFRLFGALLSGLLVTELVYYSVATSIVLPVIVGVLFTLLHALVQSYVLTMLVSLFYGEISEPVHPKSAHIGQT